MVESFRTTSTGVGPMRVHSCLEWIDLSFCRLIATDIHRIQEKNLKLGQRVLVTHGPELVLDLFLLGVLGSSWNEEVTKFFTLVCHTMGVEREVRRFLSSGPLRR